MARLNGREYSGVHFEHRYGNTESFKRISFITIPGIQTDTGYGYSGIQFIRKLQNMGYGVHYDDHEAPSQVNFCQPHFYKPRASQFCVGYTPWESTVIPDYWHDPMNSMDEIWATSTKVREWYLENGIKTPIHVVPHGIDPIWQPRNKPRGDVLKFLHVGEPAQRKGGRKAALAFQAAFPNQDDVRITFKCTTHVEIFTPEAPTYDRSKMPQRTDRRIEVIKGSVPVEQLVDIYSDHHAFVYPSQGEGFGLIPFQAAALGMPTICTEWWAMYSNLITNPLASTIVDSNNSIHLGRWASPDFDELVDHMRDIYDNYDARHDEALNKAYVLHRDYSWDTIMADVVNRLPDVGFDAVEYEGFKSEIPMNGARVFRDIGQEEALDLARKQNYKYVAWDAV